MAAETYTNLDSVRYKEQQAWTEAALAEVEENLANPTGLRPENEQELRESLEQLCRDMAAIAVATADEPTDELIMRRGRRP